MPREEQENCSIEDADDNDIADEEKGTVAKPQFIFFDFEAKQDTGEHNVNFCVVHRAYDQCIDLPIVAQCENCNLFPGGRELIFSGEQTLNHFCSWLFNPINHGSTDNCS